MPALSCRAGSSDRRRRRRRSRCRAAAALAAEQAAQLAVEVAPEFVEVGRAVAAAVGRCRSRRPARRVRRRAASASAPANSAVAAACSRRSARVRSGTGGRVRMRVMRVNDRCRSDGLGPVAGRLVSRWPASRRRSRPRRALQGVVRAPTTASASSSRSRSSPSPVTALTNTRGTRRRRRAARHGRAARAGAACPRARSILLQTSICGMSRRRRSRPARARPRRSARPACGLGAVDHVQQQVGVGRLLQRGLEGLDQLVRQVADEADRVGQRHRRAADAVEVELAASSCRASRTAGRRRRRRALTSALNSVDLPALV